MLTDPSLGGCTAPLTTDPLLIDPKAAELDEALDAAFRDAADREATLVLAFVGHGVVVDGDFYLMAVDSPAEPNSRQAILLGQRVKELLRAYRSVDGLILLLDTCGSGVAAEQAGQAWIEVLRRAGRRFELLTATGDGPASGGCFTRSLIYLLKTGRAQAVDRLGGQHLLGPINELCDTQVATRTTFDGTADLVTSDDAMWIARNAEAGWLASPLAGTAFADEAYRLTSYYQPTDALAELHALIAAGTSCVVVTGAPHTGKSTLVAALTRPDFTGVAAADHLVHAAVFRGPGYPVDQLAADIAEQLERTADGFVDATTRYRDELSKEAWDRADALERLVLGPLRARDSDTPVRIALDSNSLAGLDDLLRAAPATRLQVVVTAADTSDVPPGAAVFTVPTPRAEEIIGYARARGVPAGIADELATKAGGNWTMAALFTDQLIREPVPVGTLSADLSATYHAALRRAGATTSASGVARVLAVLAAAGDGAALPLPLLCRASGALGGPDTVPAVHEALARLDGLVTRAQPGTDTESAGLVAATVATYLREQRIGDVPAERAHRAIAEAIAAVAPMTRHRPDDLCHAYAARAEAEHLWHCGEFDNAVRSLDQRTSSAHATNRDRWGQWSRRISAELGEFHRLAIRARARFARWTAESGDRSLALDMLRQQFSESTRELGPTHRETLSIRDNIAFWTHHTDPDSARRQFTDLVPDCVEHLGPDDPQTLMAHHHLALMTSKCGNHAEAIRMWEELLPVRERVIGPHHLDTLRTQQNLLYERAENGYPPPVAFSFESLVRILRDTFGDDHPETITARYHEAFLDAKAAWHLPNPERRRIIEHAIVRLRELLPDAQRVFGTNNDIPSHIRTQLAFWPSHLDAD